jgi:hypothetical protein
MVLAITRLRFDAWLRDDAAASAEPVTGRVAAVRAGTVELDGINVNSAAQVIVKGIGRRAPGSCAPRGRAPGPNRAHIAAR